jgi:hypothetical protein
MGGEGAMTNAEKDALPPIGTYWTEGTLPTERATMVEAYWTCARCGAFVKSPDRHEDWHHVVEGSGS